MIEPQNEKVEPLPRRMKFRERVIVRCALTSPIILGMIFAPDDWLRYVMALGFLLNFFSVELVLSKLRKL